VVNLRCVKGRCDTFLETSVSGTITRLIRRVSVLFYDIGILERPDITIVHVVDQ